MSSIVFGGASGIGSAIVEVLKGIDEDPVVVDKVTEGGIRAGFPIGNSRTMKMVNALLEVKAPYDMVFITFGMPSHRKFMETELVREEQLIRGNLLAVTDALRIIQPFLHSSMASIVLTSSVSAQQADHGGALYAAAKAGVEALVRNLAREWAPIRVNGIAPGPTGTRQFLENVPAENIKKEVSRTPHRRLVEPTEVAQAAVGIALLTGVSGAILPVDLAGLSSSRRPE